MPEPLGQDPNLPKQVFYVVPGNTAIAMTEVLPAGTVLHHPGLQAIERQWLHNTQGRPTREAHPLPLTAKMAVHLLEEYEP